MVEIKNYINGEFVNALENKTEIGYNPATNKELYTRPRSSALDINAAVEAARAAFTEWSKSSFQSRFKILNAIAEKIEENHDKLAQAETQDNGKPLWLSKKVDIRRAADNIRFFATAIMHYDAESHYMPQGVQNFTVRKPLGIVGCISPWNLPLYLFTWKIAPALATGNCVIAKPSEVTPLTAYYFSEICKEVGLPPGVLNIVHGDGPDTGQAIVSHKDIKAISFTGSTRAGKDIASIAAPMFKKLSLEMGGKNPNLIFADCDWEQMLKTTIQSSFSNQGEICLCGSRILIEDSIYERFRDEFVHKVSQLKIGDPMADDTQIGAIVSEQHFEKIKSYIQIAKDEGGNILCGGQVVNPPGDCSNGYFIQPTVIDGVAPQCRTNMEEIFGPVVTLQKFSSDEEAISMANESNYGLSATIWTQNINRALGISDLLESGIIWVNTWLMRDLRTPFGGMKDSGVGREGGWHAMNFFTEPKNICIDYSTYGKK